MMSVLARNSYHLWEEYQYSHYCDNLVISSGNTRIGSLDSVQRLHLTNDKLMPSYEWLKKSQGHDELEYSILHFLLGLPES